jgi:hypothetical protein
VYIYCAKLIISLYIFQFNLYSKYEKKHTDGNFLNKIDANTIRNYEYTDKFLYDKINEKKPATEVQQPSSVMYPIINTSISNISEQQLVHLPSSVSHSSSLHSYSRQSQQPSSTQSSYTTSKLSADSSNTLSADSSNTLSTYKYNTIEAQPIKNRIQTPRVLQVKPSPQTSTQQEQQLYSSLMREPAKLQDGGKRKSKKIFK